MAMRRVALGLAGLALAAGAGAATGKIPWQTDFATAQKLSQRLKKPILVDFYADW